MRLKGTIVEWQDDRGFGFIEPIGGGERVFCHIKAFTVRVRRPMAGDSVTYDARKDAKGRLQASEVRPAGLEQAAYSANIGSRRAANHQRSPKRARRGSGVGSYIFLAFFAASLGMLLVTGRIAFFVPLIYAGMSGLTLFAYAFDKSAAMNNRWRTQEQTLHLLELAGGWPGGLIAQNLFRHKSTKTSFLVEFWMWP
jgi:uncharacterized membrane protein YsdA (DUF1294 family)/cold shock CspA family protein